ncbi:bacillithiol system redox-active protein YtxJ [Snuella sedimenti]|uniref:Bacillithiol system redox-active protein YtxJ n=1 Tax=Snuella sedimenti TaxID=2798802 RepID=A0A8J7J553_9FLAO|nr:bacillithiol system redox-active protein YtxJ [Snuella sedimenti]MBJ6368759.1 bacillithiol system redox-active protein YtxJ [Snuella sedimenti]
MGFINKLFGGTTVEKETKTLPWIALEAFAQIDELIKKSNNKPQVIFKHSTRCGISRMALNQFEESYAMSDDALDIYYLDLINFRDLSNEIASRFQVWHESPQILVIKNELAVTHASHGAIADVNINKFI